MVIAGITIVGRLPLGNRRRPELKRDRRLAPKYERLLGNARTRRGRENALLTARQDLVSVRESVLGGDRDATLGKVDWLIDRIDNMLAEGC